MHKVRLNPAFIESLRASGNYPFAKGGVEFGEDTEIETETLGMFAEAEQAHGLDPRLIAEEIHADSETSD